MEEEYLLAWNDHHQSIITSMSELASGDVLTDVSVWAGQTLYSAHKLVLALSSHYFRLVVTGVPVEGKHPVIFLKDVSSKDFERLLQYMYRGEVSVPQSELLSLITAAKSLGIRGLTEGLISEDRKDSPSQISSATKHARVSQEAEHSKHTYSPTKRGRWEQEDGDRQQSKWREGSEHAQKEKKRKSTPVKEEARSSTEKETNGREDDIAEQPAEASGTHGSMENQRDKARPGSSVSEGKSHPPFLEVTVKQEEEEIADRLSNNEENEQDESSVSSLRLLRRPLLFPPPTDVRPSLGALPSVQANLLHHTNHLPLAASLNLHALKQISTNSTTSTHSTPTIQRNTGTCHFCGRSFMKNKQLMNHVCPMRPPAKS